MRGILQGAPRLHQSSDTAMIGLKAESMDQLHPSPPKLDESHDLVEATNVDCRAEVKLRVLARAHSRLVSKSLSGRSRPTQPPRADFPRQPNGQSVPRVRRRRSRRQGSAAAADGLTGGLEDHGGDLVRVTGHRARVGVLKLASDLIHRSTAISGQLRSERQIVLKPVRVPPGSTNVT